jgi:hypothetical protein
LRRRLGKQLEVLREAIPELRRAAILSNPANPAHALALSNVKVAAQNLGVELQLLETRGPDQFEEAFLAMAKNRAEALPRIFGKPNRPWASAPAARGDLGGQKSPRPKAPRSRFLLRSRSKRSCSFSQR